MAKRAHHPFKPKGLRHPSGRPIRKQSRGVISRPRFVDTEPLTPGLRRDEPAEAIGFISSFAVDGDDEEEFDYTRETE